MFFFFTGFPTHLNKNPGNTPPEQNVSKYSERCVSIAYATSSGIYDTHRIVIVSNNSRTIYTGVR